MDYTEIKQYYTGLVKKTGLPVYRTYRLSFKVEHRLDDGENETGEFELEKFVTCVGGWTAVNKFSDFFIKTSNSSNSLTRIVLTGIVCFEEETMVIRAEDLAGMDA